MSASINIQGFPSPFMFVGPGGTIVVELGDERGRVLTDEAGQVLQPDLKAQPVVGDEASNVLTDENNNTLTPDGL